MSPMEKQSIHIVPRLKNFAGCSENPQKSGREKRGLLLRADSLRVRDHPTVRHGEGST